MQNATAWFVYCLRRYTQFSGRASRPEYWWFQAFVWVIHISILVLKHLIPRVALVLAIFFLGLMIPHLAVASRRLHDCGHSLWWIALPALGSTIVFAQGEEVSWIVLLVTVGLALSVVYLLCEPGNKGWNRYGEPAPTSPD
jgi:uncharacterized membrane protein YhaH (DUF805 family)